MLPDADEYTPLVVDVAEDTEHDMDPEEELARRRASVKCSRAALGVFAGLGAMSVTYNATTGSGRKLPESFDDLVNHLPLFSFLFIIGFISVRMLLKELDVRGCGEWHPSNELKFFIVVDLWPIINGWSGGDGACLDSLVNAGCMAALIATICYNVNIGRDDVKSTLSVVSGALVVAGVLIHMSHNNFWDNLPFWAWATTGGVYYFFLLSGRGKDGHNGSVLTSWLMLVYAALWAAARQGEDWIKTCAWVGCLAGVVLAVLYALQLSDERNRRFLGGLALVLTWFPLCWVTLKGLSADDIVDRAPFFALAISLFVCALFECVLEKKKVATGQWILLLCLYTVLWRAHDPDGNWKLVGQIGSLFGLIALVLEVLDAGGKHRNLLIRLAEILCSFALLFG